MARPFCVLALAIGVSVVLPASLLAPQPAEAREARRPGFFQQLGLSLQPSRKSERRSKRGTRPAQERQARPSSATDPQRPGKRGKRGVVPPPVMAQPAEELLPAPKGPPTLEPRARTTSEQEGWRTLASQVAPPAGAPLISEDGPAPVPATVHAMYSPAKPVIEPPAPRPRRSLEPQASLDVPLPPQRPEADAPDASPDSSAADIPFPPRRPGEQMTSLPPADVKPQPDAPDIAFPDLSYADDPDCQALEKEDVVVSKPMDPIEGPGVCGSPAPVSMTGVKLKDGSTVDIKPAATLRCSMARTLAAYVRDDLAPAAEKDGEALAKIEVAGSFMCRGRNGAAGGKMSEHGRADAIDLSGLALKGGKAFGIYAKDMPQELKAQAKSGACDRFNTVLGPGSDGHHEDHLHLDLQPRRSKSKLCQWHDPAPDVADAAKPEDEKAADAKDGKKDDAGKPEERQAAKAADKADDDRPSRRSRDERPMKRVEGLEPERPLVEAEKPVKASARRTHAPRSLSRADRTP